MAIPITGLDHVVIRTANIEALLKFYIDVLGCPEERRLEKLGLYQLRAGDSLIDLVDTSAPIGQAGGNAPAPTMADGGRNLDHFCLRVTPFDEGAIRRHLAEHGVTAGPAEDRYGAEGTGPSIYFEDPDGNVVELKGPAYPSE